MVHISVVLRFKSAKQIWRSFKLNTIVKPATPGLQCPPKLWWAKEITPDIHVSGRLTRRQLKYASEGGFKSLIAFNIDQHGTFAGETLPSPSDISSICNLTGMQAQFIQGSSNIDNIPNLQSIKQFSRIFTNLEKPILLTGNTQKNATFLALLHVAYQGDVANETIVTSKDIFNLAATMGYDFTTDEMKSIVAEVTGEDVVDRPPKPDLENTSVADYWPAHRIGKNWYTSGQIRRQELQILERAGFKSIINMRLGTEYNKTPSQEPVTLLNIKDSLATYDASKNPTRLNSKVLEENRVFPQILPTYIDDGSIVNYETKNEEEFGDEVGYNENIERDYVHKHSNLNYTHMPFPLPNGVYTREMFEEVKDELVTADRDGPVLLHCRIGKRVAYFGILALAIKEGRSLQWAQKRSIEMGHEVSPEARQDVYKLYTEYLKSE